MIDLIKNLWRTTLTGKNVFKETGCKSEVNF